MARTKEPQGPYKITAANSKPSETSLLKITLTNFSPSDSTLVHQRALLLHGHISPPPPHALRDSHIFITTRESCDGHDIFPAQSWPLSHSADGCVFKALVLLTPGDNTICIAMRSNHTNETITSLTRMFAYIPQIQVPPLHLAIVVAKDSPLLMDCPASKAGGISTAHSSLDAAVAKLRMAAYMWQAMTAEDLRSKGLGRRSFRLEEEWGADTVSSAFLSSASDEDEDTTPFRATAKVHIVASDKTTAELRDAAIAQQNAAAPDRRKQELHKHFTAALAAHGAPFTRSASRAPLVVAGLILDSHYSPSQDLILAHAALGNPLPDPRTGISLGIFGSHTCWAWPRFVEELPHCLTDATLTDTFRVANDNGECGTAWEACAVGQGAMLHEVGHALGCQHTTGIMARGYARDWVKHFVPATARGLHREAEAVQVCGEQGWESNNAVWDVKDALAFSWLPHFRVSGDERLDRKAARAVPAVTVEQKGNGDGSGELHLVLSALSGLSRVSFNGVAEERPQLAWPVEKKEYTVDELERRFGRDGTPLKLSVVASNGKEKVVGDVWKLFSQLSFIRIPGSDIVLQKRSIRSGEIEEHEGEEGYDYWQWAALLTDRNANGKRTHASAFDMRVGIILDGGVLHYADGHKTHLGPRFSNGGWEHHFGGHASEEIALSPNNPIAKIEVHAARNELVGIRTTLADGTVRGELNSDGNEDCSDGVGVLEPGPDEHIVGFFGRSDWGRGFDGIHEFGIITAPRDVDLPERVYEMDELKNTDGGVYNAAANE
ncbi:hypothetical protein SLS55_000965 [Diplodia seriata]|uniref:Zinc metalloproteinase n=1 Tax=Diplodia seriata TaxID=420778 RepID=A0ABR3CWW8_9PEZI